MLITHDDVARMAALARLDVPPETQARFTRQFADILTYMDILNEVDTTAVAPMYSPVEYSPLEHAENRRADTARPSPPREDVLRNAPQQDGAYFIVPRIV